MISRCIAMLVPALLLLAGCANHEGRFEPSCMAFAGETIELRDGRFSWNRFTDEERISEDGARIDPYPDFPKSGSYTLKKDRVYLLVGGKTVDVERRLYDYNGDLYLLTPEQHDSVSSNARIPECALQRVDAI